MVEDISTELNDPWLSFSEIRRGPDGNLAIIANPRRRKPKKGTSESTICIFCPEGRISLAEPYFEDDLREEMGRRGLYVVQNKFSVVSPPEADDEILRFAKRSLGWAYDRDVIRGTHLVMIETPIHDMDPFSDTEQTRDYYSNLIWGYIQMLRSLRHEEFSWGGVGKNRNGVDRGGSIIRAGASQPHSHSQAIGMNVYPRWLEGNLRSSADYDRLLATDSERIPLLQGCPECLESRIHHYDVIRKIEANNMHASFVSPIPKPNPYHVEIKILPYRHQTLFDEMTDEETQSFANILHKTMVALNRGYPNCGYNFELRQGLWKTELRSYDPRNFHWNFSIYPAWPSLDTIRYNGFMSNLLQASVLTEQPENLARKLK